MWNSDLDEELAYALGIGDEYETYRKELPTRSRNLNVRLNLMEQIGHCTLLYWFLSSFSRYVH